MTPLVREKNERQDLFNIIVISSSTPFLLQIVIDMLILLIHNSDTIFHLITKKLRFYLVNSSLCLFGESEKP